MGLIFDTSELIKAERQRQSLAGFIAGFDIRQPMYISVVTVAELQHGIRRAATSEQRQRRSNFLREVLSVLEIHPLTIRTAMRTGDLDAQMAMTGERLDFADLAIAATALEFDLTLVTSNLRHFERIPGLRIFQST